MTENKLQLLALWTQNLMVARVNTVVGCNTFLHCTEGDCYAGVQGNSN